MFHSVNNYKCTMNISENDELFFSLLYVENFCIQFTLFIRLQTINWIDWCSVRLWATFIRMMVASKNKLEKGNVIIISFNENVKQIASSTYTQNSNEPLLKSCIKLIEPRSKSKFKESMWFFTLEQIQTSELSQS